MSTPEIPAMRAGKRAPPKLDLRAFQSPAPHATSNNGQTRRAYPLGLIDAHIHLWTSKQLEDGDMQWQRECGDGDDLKQLSGPHDLEAYARITKDAMPLFTEGKSQHTGVIYVQAE
jgi:hypothetical protein